MNLNIYLYFIDKTEEAFNFYKEVLGGEFSDINRYKDMPEGDKQPDADKNRIMHISLKLGNNMVLMGSDFPTEREKMYKMGNNFSISLNTESEAETTEVFNKLAKGGIITMPLEKTFWNAYFGMLTDKFGVNWMVNCDLGHK